MALSIISNYAANVAHRNLTATDAAASSSLAKLSSGSRIVQAKDDAASLAIGSRLSGEVAALKQAGINAGQAASMLQIADGAFARASDILNRMKALAVQSSSGQLSDTERSILDTEYTALKNELLRIGNDTEFNGVKLIAGSQTVTLGTFLDGNEGVDSIHASGVAIGTMTIEVATTGGNVTFTATDADGVVYEGTISSSAFTANQLTAPTSISLTSSNANQTGVVTLNLNTALSNATSISAGSTTVAGSDTTSLTFKVGTGVVAAEDDLTISLNSLVSIGNSLASNIATSGAAATAIDEVSTAITNTATARANIGAVQSRLDFAQANIATSTENVEAARSQLLDLDVAAEITTFTSKQVLLQAGVSMLAQANQLPQGLLRLFQ
ncbi:MAG TPA: flagellin [Alphaproteobacteria bacterium]|jgi:flagellin